MGALLPGSGCHDATVSLMICNVPCSVSQSQLAEAVDSIGFAGKYNFLYLPVKGRSSKSGASVRRSNLGYGFIDFTSAEDASSFTYKFTGFRFQGTKSQKSCEVRAAHVHGSVARTRSAKPVSSTPLPDFRHPGSEASAATGPPASSGFLSLAPLN